LCLRYRRPELLAESREALASVLKCARKDVVYVKNATMGVNIILRNLKYVRGDAIIYFSDIYAGCEKTIASLVETTALQSRRIAYTHPNTHDELVQKFRDEVAKARKDGLNVRVAIFDSIVSQPGVRFPFEKLVEVCREEGILSCVDAAHGIGHIPLDIGKLDPDFLVTNVHK
jgi:selenocysteine lyase/cysteine desulfurase